MSLAITKRELKATNEKFQKHSADLSQLLNIALNPVVDLMAYQAISETVQEQLLPEEARLEKLRREFKSMLMFDPERKRLFEALSIICEWGPTSLTEATWREIQSGLKKIRTVLLKNDWHTESLAPLLDLPQQFFMALYSFSRGFIEKGQQDKALQILFFLVVLAPGSAQFWVAYGMLNQHARHFNTALNAYSNALELKPHEVPTLLRIADCYADMLQVEQMESYIKEAEERLPTNLQEQWREVIRAIRSKIGSHMRRE